MACERTVNLPCVSSVGPPVVTNANIGGDFVMEMQGVDRHWQATAHAAHGGKVVIRRIPGYTTDGPSGYYLEHRFSGRILEVGVPASVSAAARPS